MSKPIFNILICTLEEREEQLKHLRSALYAQILQEGLQGKVGIHTLCDNRERTTGAKRHLLLQESDADFSAFVDDDDRVSDTYVRDVVQAIKAHPVDVVGFFGEVIFHGGESRKMVHSLACLDWTEDSMAYYRPPNHLNPVRTELARMVSYPDLTISEDHHWSLGLKELGVLQREVFLGTKPLYYYICKSQVKGL